MRFPRTRIGLRTFMLLILTALLLTGVAMLIKPPRARAILANPVFNFGVLPQRVEARHVWTIRNQGRAFLKIWPMESTVCAVMANPRPDKPILLAPGGHTTVELVWATRSYSGKYRQFATIGTNDPEHPTIVFEARGEIRPFESGDTVGNPGDR
jgi:hypothetical protein